MIPWYRTPGVVTVAVGLSENRLELAAAQSPAPRGKSAGEVLPRPLDQRSVGISGLDEAGGQIVSFVSSLGSSGKPLNIASPKIRLLFSLPRRLVATRFLELPSLDEGELKAMSGYLAASGLPFPEEDLLWDALVLRRNEREGHSDVLLAVAGRSLIEPYLKVFSDLGRLPDGFVLSCFALREYLEKVKGVSLRDYLRIDFCDGWMEMDVFGKGCLAATRSVPLSPGGALWDRVVRECRDSLALRADRQVEGPKSIVVSGINEAGMGECRKALEDQFKVPVEFFHADREGGPSPAVLGACMASSRWHLNLLTKEQKNFQEHRRRSKAIGKASAWAAAWAAVLLMTAGWGVFHKKRELARLDAQIARLEPSAGTVAGVFKKASFLKTQMDVAASPLETLRELHKIAPPGSLLTSLTYDAGGPVVMQGTARRLSEVMDWVERLQRSPLFSRAELRSSSSRMIQDKEWVDFQVQCLTETRAAYEPR